MYRIFLLRLLLLSQWVLANTGYQTPNKMMADLVDAPQRPGFSISPNKQWVAVLNRPGLASIEELAQPEAKLAGLRINPNIFSTSRATGYNGIELRSLIHDHYHQKFT